MSRPPLIRLANCLNCGNPLTGSALRQCDEKCRRAYASHRLRTRRKRSSLQIPPESIEPDLDSAQPVEVGETMEPDRRFDCRGYERCLSYASIKGWLGFGCGQCSKYQPPSDGEARAMRERDMALLRGPNNWERAAERGMQSLDVTVFRKELNQAIRKLEAKRKAG